MLLFYCSISIAVLVFCCKSTLSPTLSPRCLALHNYSLWIYCDQIRNLITPEMRWQNHLRASWEVPCIHATVGRTAKKECIWTSTFLDSVRFLISACVHQFSLKQLWVWIISEHSQSSPKSSWITNSLWKLNTFLRLNPVTLLCNSLVKWTCFQVENMEGTLLETRIQLLFLVVAIIKSSHFHSFDLDRQHLNKH